jgi:hypothetical protein
VRPEAPSTNNHTTVNIITMNANTVSNSQAQNVQNTEARPLVSLRTAGQNRNVFADSTLPPIN